MLYPDFLCGAQHWLMVSIVRSLHVWQTSTSVRSELPRVILIPLMLSLSAKLIKPIINLFTELLPGWLPLTKLFLEYLFRIFIDYRCASQLLLLLHLAQLHFESYFHDSFLLFLLLILQELLHGPLSFTADPWCTFSTTYLRLIERSLIGNKGTAFDLLKVQLFLHSCYLFIFLVLELSIALLKILKVEAFFLVWMLKWLILSVSLEGRASSVMGCARD